MIWGRFFMNNEKSANSSFFVHYLQSLILCIIIFISLISIASLLFYKEILDIKYVKAVSYVILFISTFGGTFLCRSKNNILKISIPVFLSIIVLLLILGYVIYNTHITYSKIIILFAISFISIIFSTATKVFIIGKSNGRKKH